VTPPPTIANTYQGGTVVKLNRVTFDADAYHIHFTNTYSTYTPSTGPDEGFTYYYANPDSTTNGFEAEGKRGSDTQPELQRQWQPLALPST